MKFLFRLQSVLKLRQLERENQRQLAIQARLRHADSVAIRNRLIEDRATVLGEIRNMNEGEAWAADQAVSRQRHAEQLGHALAHANAAVAQAESERSACLKKLIVAHQAVQALERLAERQLTEFQSFKRKRETREFEDILKPDQRAA